MGASARGAHHAFGAPIVVQRKGVHVSHFAGRTRSLAILATAVACAVLALTGASPAATSTRGQLDTSFGSNGFASAGSDTQLFGTAVQRDGKTVAVGAIGFNTNNVRLLVVRFTATGALDPSFGGGKVIGPGSVIGRGVAIQPDGKIVVAGQATDATGASTNGIVAERFTSSGTPDSSFGTGGIARALTNDPQAAGNGVVVQSDGKVVVAGSGTISSGPDAGIYPGAALVRFTPGGALDGSFAGGGAEVADLGRYSVANGVALQPDGKIVIGGSVRDPGLQNTLLLAARFASNGSADGSFGSGGKFSQQYAGTGGGYSEANAVALQPDGKVVLAGSALTGTGINAVFVRLTSGGAPDGSFGSGGAAQLPASDQAAPPPTGARFIPYAAGGVVVVSGEIYATGWLWHTNHVKQLVVWALTSGGAPDGGFGSGGRTVIGDPTPNTGIQGSAIAVRPDGNLAVAGSFLPPPLPPAPGTGFVSVFALRALPPPPPPALKTTLRAPRTVKIRTATRSGVSVTAGCNQACTIRLTLTVSSGDAKRLRLKTHGRRPVTIATSSTRLTRAGTRVLVLRLSGGAKKGLGRLRSLSAGLQGLFAATATRKSSSVSTRITFKR
jgi:uncharacterized delta-60 repeat protein